MHDDTPAPELTDLERSILDFESHWWRYAGAKEQAIRERFDCTGSRYYQRLNRLLDHPAAVAYAPTLVNQLRRSRAVKARARSARRQQLAATA